MAVVCVHPSREEVFRRKFPVFKPVGKSSADIMPSFVLDSLFLAFSLQAGEAEKLLQNDVPSSRFVFPNRSGRLTKSYFSGQTSLRLCHSGILTGLEKSLPYAVTRGV